MKPVAASGVQGEALHLPAQGDGLGGVDQGHPGRVAVDQRLGLPVNYLTPLPAITLFGFRFDESYSNAASDELQDGISAALAKKHGTPLYVYSQATLEDHFGKGRGGLQIDL